ncbi:aldo/keto reductase [Propionibacteriaceae bacterium Y1923]|uniref:aldo/keto reductase n=1 Tax=Aestuariimicrobium sp. Y1814 TaxID=3418742 RepID=UPI003C21378F
MDETITLRAGTVMPRIGFGTYKVTPDTAQQTVETALEVGYRHLDTAAMYGNEAEVGAAIKASGINRDELFVTTKLDNPYHEPAEAKAAFDRSMEALGLDVLDLYLIHWPLPRTTDYVATWATLVELQATGRVREIGVSNFKQEHLQAAIDATGVTPAVNQVEVNPYFTNDELRAFHAEHGIVTQAWSPLARGRLLEDPALVEVAERVGRPTSQVVLRWHLQRGEIIIPKSTHRERMEQNFAVTDFELDDAAMAAVSALNRDERSGSGPDDVELGTKLGKPRTYQS